VCRPRLTGEIQTRVPHQAAAVPTRRFRQTERPPRALAVGAVHHAVGMEARMLDAVREPDEPERRGAGRAAAAEKGRAGDVRLQVRQDHAGQVRQPFGPGGAVPLRRGLVVVRHRPVSVVAYRRTRPVEKSPMPTTFQKRMYHTVTKKAKDSFEIGACSTCRKSV